MWLSYSPISHPHFSLVTISSDKNEIINRTCNEVKSLAPVVQKVDSASIHRINHYPVDYAISFAIPYPMNSDLSGG